MANINAVTLRQIAKQSINLRQIQPLLAAATVFVTQL